MKEVPWLPPLRYQWWALYFVLVFLTSCGAQLKEAEEPMYASLRRPTALIVEVTSSSYENKGGLVAFNITNGTGSWVRVRITDASFVFFDGVLPPEEADISRKYVQGWPMYTWEMSLPPREYQIEATGESLAKSTTNMLLDPSKQYDLIIRTKSIESAKASSPQAAVNESAASHVESTPVQAHIHGQDYSPDQITSAISRGLRNAGQPQGLLLEDASGQASQLLAGLASASGAPLSPGTQVPGKGFRAWAFTPLEWISEQASEAIGHGRNFTTSDVTQDMLRPVFRVRAYPSTKPDTGPNYGQGVSPVVNVIIKDASRKDELDPINRQPFTYEGMQGQTVEFPMDGLNRIRQKNPEFYIVVIGTNGNSKDFKVKKKHFSQLE